MESLIVHLKQMELNALKKCNERNGIKYEKIPPEIIKQTLCRKENFS